MNSELLEDGQHLVRRCLAHSVDTLHGEKVKLKPLHGTREIGWQVSELISRIRIVHPEIINPDREHHRP